MNLNTLIKENNIIDAVKHCLNEKYNDLAMLLLIVYKDKNGSTKEFLELQNKINQSILPNNLLIPSKKIKVYMACNWCSSEDLLKTWNKMSENMNLSWGNVQLVSCEPCDFYCIINKPPPGMIIDKKKTILFRMEPHMEKNIHQFGEEYANPNPNDFFFVASHDKYYNNNEWHLSKSYKWLSSETIEKDESLSSTISTILSDKYRDPGHIKRIDFVKFIEKKLSIHVYGNNRFLYKDYKGSLPYHNKDNSLLPYKYSFNVENHSIKNYYTEKVIDGILSETLVFYSGCFNLRDYIDERAFVYLELSNFEKDLSTIKQAIDEDWYSQRLPYIKEAKKKILNELQFFPRLQRICNNIFE
jgi:hypothetical protein